MSTDDENEAGSGTDEPTAPDAVAGTGDAGDATGAESAAAESTGGAVAVATAAAPVPAEPVEVRPPDSFKTRLLMPIVLPLASIFVAVLVALNISRLFLAGGEERAPAVIIATVITIGVLVGAALVSSARHVRTSSLVLGLSLVLVLIFSAGLVTYGSGAEKEQAEGPKAPTGPAVNTLAVDALPSLSFQAKEFTVPPGINEIDYVDKGGTHTLVFADPTLSFFNLMVPSGPTKGKVDLVAGKDYTIYCTISGHRAAGMEATIHVVEGAPPTGAGAAPAAGDTTTTTAG